MAYAILTLGMFFLIEYAKGSCGNCQPNYVACEGLDTFSICIDGVPRADEILRCPHGRVCTDKPAICIENTNSSFEASCGKGCGVCDSHDKVFSCVGISKVAFCYGEMVPFDWALATCPEGYVCDLSSKAICVRKDYSMGSCERDYNSSTPTTTTTGLPVVTVPTTSTSIRDPKTFCRENSMEGTFPAEGDMTCKKYYVCKAISNGSKYTGYSFTCSGSYYFDPVKRFCTQERPASC